MPFSEALKSAVKEKANFACCICWDNTQPIEVHHIVPAADEGPDTEENAAPLCSSHHTMYGGNPDLRKWIRDRRDFWYDQCESRRSFSWPANPTAPLLEKSEPTTVRTARMVGGTQISEGRPAIKLRDEDNSLAFQISYTVEKPGMTQPWNKALSISAHTPMDWNLGIEFDGLDDWNINGLLKVLRGPLDAWIFWGPSLMRTLEFSHHPRLNHFFLVGESTGNNRISFGARSRYGAGLSIQARFTDPVGVAIADYLESAGITDEMPGQPTS